MWLVVHRTQVLLNQHGVSISTHIGVWTAMPLRGRVHLLRGCVSHLLRGRIPHLLRGRVPHLLRGHIAYLLRGCVPHLLRGRVPHLL